MSDSTQSSAPYYLQSEELRVGIFVELDLAWFKHDFVRNAFKIESEETLRKVLALRLPRYRYDPERSDPPPRLESAHEADRAEPSVPVESVEHIDPLVLEELRREKFWAEREMKMAEVKQAFLRATDVMKTLNRDLVERPKETYSKMVALVDEMTASFLESRDVTLHVMGDQEGGPDVYYHELNVTILALMLAKGLDFTSEMARELAIGAMVHDIGLMKIPSRVTKKNPNEYTSAERNMRAMHVEYGREIALQAGLSAQAVSVITQHHEYVDGSGYPGSMMGVEMTPAARVISLINYYDNLCNPVEVTQAMSPHDALSLMFAQRRSKFDPKTLALLIRSLGVYPPGSIVQLSNGVIASVISINPKRSLRPCVQVYDANVPKEKAIMLDLELEPTLTITKAVNFSLLSAKVLAYLRPNKRVTYFFEENKSSGNS